MHDEQKNKFPAVSSFFAFSEKLASNYYLKLVVAFLMPVVIFLRYPVEPFDYDVWWQMALGKYYVTHHTVFIDHSMFSWTPVDSTWIYNTFLGSIIIFLIYDFGGGFGLWVLQLSVFFGLFITYFIYLKILQQKIDVTNLTVFTVLGIIMSLSCRFYKPEMFSPLLFFCLGVIAIVVKVSHKKILLYTYPFIFALWVNVHGGFVLGFCLLIGLSIAELLNRMIFPRDALTTNELMHLWIASFLSFLATFLNPYGANYLFSIFNGVMSETYNISNKYLQSYISLWPYLKSIKDINPVTFFKTGQIVIIMTIMMLMIIVLMVYDFAKNKSFDFFVLIAIIVTYLGSMTVVRTIYVFPITFVLIFYLFYRLKLKNISARATLLSLILFILLFINNLYFVLRYENENQWFGSGLEGFAPVQEVAFLKKYHLEGQIFNDYLIGGYLLWDLYPDYKVFIDSRLVPYSKQVAPDYWEFVSKPATTEDIHRFTQKYPFKIAIIHYREMPLIFDFLKAGWRLLYFEKNAAIVVHPSMLFKIPRDVRQVDLGPMRFQDVKNPFILLNVFSLYVNLNPQASVVIYDIYRKNISDLYKLKSDHLRVMENDMRLRQLQHK